MMSARSLLRVVALSVAVTLVAGACSKRESIRAEHSPASVQTAGQAEPDAPERFLRASAAPPGGRSKAGVDLEAMGEAQPDRYLIKNASVVIEVEDAAQAADALAGVVKAAGGYMADMKESLSPLGARTITMQVRVPADKFDQTMGEFEPVGKVLTKQVTSQDVTEEFLDTDARVRNLKKTEERVLDHLNRSGGLDEILRVEQELGRYRQEIERIEGRLRFLQHRVAFSTITVTLQESAKTEPFVPIKSFSSGKIFSEASRSLVGFAQNLWTIVIWLAVWSPIWLPSAIIIRFVMRRIVK